MDNFNIHQPTPEEIKESSNKWETLKKETQKVIVGQSNTIEKIFIGILCNSHILLEGVPGIAKTTIIKTISKALGLDFKRIQFTPDLLPADLIGTLIYNPKTQEFQTKKGPIFTNIILADEINRAPAKVQSALLEAMQEHQVTIGDQTFTLEEPFFVLATQNPIDQEGTYRLPEAQVDRFLFKLIMTYPSYEEEKNIVNKAMEKQTIHQIINQKEILDDQEIVKRIYMDDKIVEYIINIVFATRFPKKRKMHHISHYIEYGASPRASLSLANAAKAHAFLKKRHFVIPDDVKAVVRDTLRHRIILTYEAEAENVTTDQIIQTIIREIPAP